jgi:hypothetical protein
MPEYNPKDINQETVLLKDGDRSFEQMVFPTLTEAVQEVACWSGAEQAKALFRITGTDKGYEYSWADIPFDY